MHVSTVSARHACIEHTVAAKRNNSILEGFALQQHLESVDCQIVGRYLFTEHCIVVQRTVWLSSTPSS